MMELSPGISRTHRLHQRLPGALESRGKALVRGAERGFADPARNAASTAVLSQIEPRPRAVIATMPFPWIAMAERRWQIFAAADPNWSIFWESSPRLRLIADSFTMAENDGWVITGAFA